MLSRACEYGIKACIYLAEQTLEDRRCGYEEVANKIDAPVPFTAKILQSLAKKDIIQSQKGPNGGFSLSQPQLYNTKVYDIIVAIDGDGIMNACILGFESCNAKKPCALHHKFVAVRTALNESLWNNTLLDIIPSKQRKK